MQRVFESDLDEIKQQILTMAGLVEKSLDDVAKVVISGDRQLAESVIARDDEIDRCELEVDRLGAEFIVRHQPVATDLRFVIVAIKISPSLERIADNAVNIARYLCDIERFGWIEPGPDLPRILALTRAMVEDVIQAFVSRNVDSARDVIKRDDEVDQLYWKLFDGLLVRMEGDPSLARAMISQLLVVRFAERIGDQATNIAEEVIYLVEGESVRHSGSTVGQLTHGETGRQGES
jgi:phosphate transport system protein